MLAFLFMLLKTLHKTSAMGSWQTFTPSLYLLNLLIMVMLLRTSTSIPYRIAGKQMQQCFLSPSSWLLLLPLRFYVKYKHAARPGWLAGLIVFEVSKEGCHRIVWRQFWGMLLRIIGMFQLILRRLIAFECEICICHIHTNVASKYLTTIGSWNVSFFSVCCALLLFYLKHFKDTIPQGSEKFSTNV